MFSLPELCFRYDGYRNFHSRRTDRQLRALPRGRISREPFAPLFVQAREIGFVNEDERRLHDLLKPAAGRFEDSLNVAQALRGLLLDCCADDFARRIEWPLTGNEHKAARLHRLTVDR